MFFTNQFVHIQWSMPMHICRRRSIQYDHSRVSIQGDHSIICLPTSSVFKPPTAHAVVFHLEILVWSGWTRFDPQRQVMMLALRKTPSIKAKATKFHLVLIGVTFETNWPTSFTVKYCLTLTFDCNGSNSWRWIENGLALWIVWYSWELEIV